MLFSKQSGKAISPGMPLSAHSVAALALVMKRLAPSPWPPALL